MVEVTLPVFLACAVAGYLLGSIPFGLVLTRLAGLGDIRAIGSGNIGATNVLRTGRRDLALATLLLDAGKAGLAYFLSVWGVSALGQASGVEYYPAWAHTAGLFAGAAAFIGHCYPVWLGFKGGKGVATYIGLLLAAAWPVGIVWALTWLVIAFVFRISSLAALVACAVAPVVAYVVDPGAIDWLSHLVPRYVIGPANYTWIVTGVIAVLIYWRHRANIQRLFAGTEPRIGAKKKAAAETPDAS